MAGFEEKKAELDALGVKVVAASVDAEDKASEVAEGLSFPVAHGVTREDGEKLGSWWDERRDYIQPSEFVIDRDGRILNSSYSDGPLARLAAEDVVSLLGFIEARRKQKQG